jgi:Flp pilus assembly protein TadG
MGRSFSSAGQSALELAIILPVLLLLLLAAADFGRALYVSAAVQNAARAGAQYGSQSVITAADSAGMVAAAKKDASEITNLTATASQCTCASSSNVAACPQSYCTNNPEANYVEVDTHASFQLIGTYLGIPSPVQLSGKAVMQVQP